MKPISTTTAFRRRALRAGVALLLILLAAPAAQAQMPETFAYQGFLLDAAGVPVTGTVNLSFSLYDAATDGTVLWQEDQIEVPVAEGVFTVQLGRQTSFDDVSFDGSLWLGVRVNGGAELAPRVALSAVPYSLRAGSLAEEALQAGENIAITRSGEALVISATGGDGAAWHLGGNSGTTASTDFIGTTDAEPFEIRVDGSRALRLEPAADTTSEGPNVIGGWRGNGASAGVVGATIAGGGDPDYFGRSWPNQVTASYGTVGGGARNTAGGTWATVTGGRENTAAGEHATVGGGFGNTAGSRGAAVPGGAFNQARAPFSFAAGINARAAHEGAFVWSDNSQSSSDSLVSTGNNQFLIRAQGGVGIGTNAPSSPLTVAGVIESTTGGFQFPDGTVQTTAATGGGGTGWQLGGNSGTTVSSDFIGTTDGEPLEMRVGGLRVMRYEPETAIDGPNVVGGWSRNIVAEGVYGATIAGGGRLGNTTAGLNQVTAVYGTIGGGRPTMSAACTPPSAGAPGIRRTACTPRSEEAPGTRPAVVLALRSAGARPTRLTLTMLP